MLFKVIAAALQPPVGTVHISGKMLLQELGFDMYSIMFHPHNFLLYYIRLLGGSQGMAQRAWSYLNDSLRLDLCGALATCLYS